MTIRDHIQADSELLRLFQTSRLFYNCAMHAMHEGMSWEDFLVMTLKRAFLKIHNQDEELLEMGSLIPCPPGLFPGDTGPKGA